MVSTICIQCGDHHFVFRFRNNEHGIKLLICAAEAVAAKSDGHFTSRGVAIVQTFAETFRKLASIGVLPAQTNLPKEPS